MNTQLKYLNDLVTRGVIDKTDYANRLYLAYENDPESFTGKDTDYIEKVMKASEIPFNRDMEAAEATLGSTLNQFVSGFAEGFTTFGWADEADTSTEAIASKMGHLVGLAPDILAGVFSMGASIPTAVAKAALRTGSKGSSKVVRGSIKARRATLDAQRKYQSSTMKIAEKLKIGNFDLRKEVVNKRTGEKTYHLRSVPMRISDWVIENGQASLDKNGLLASGFLSKGLLGNDRFRKIAHDGIHLGIALGVSARKEGPGGMVEGALHGAMAGAVFGGISEMTNIGKLLANPNTKKLGEEALRKLVVKPQEKEAVVNLFARGVLGSAYTGGMATAQDLPLPEQVYEYALGFFFGASGRSVAEIKATEYLSTNPLPGRANLPEAKTKMENTKEYKALPKESKEYIERHFDILNVEQADNVLQIYDYMGVEYVEEVLNTKDKDGKPINPAKITPEQHKEVSEKLKEKHKFDNLPEEDFDVRLEDVKESLKKEIKSQEKPDIEVSKPPKEREALTDSEKAELEKLEDKKSRIESRDNDYKFDKIMGPITVKQRLADKLLGKWTPTESMRLSDLKNKNLLREEYKVELKEFEKAEEAKLEIDIENKTGKEIEVEIENAIKRGLDEFSQVVKDQKNEDLGQEVKKDKVTKEIYSQIKEKYPELDFETLGTVLKDSILNNLSNPAKFMKDLERAYPDVKLDSKKLTQYFKKKFTHRISPSLMVDLNGKTVRIGPDGRETDAYGHLIVTSESPNKENSMYGGNRVRQILKYVENTQERPLTRADMLKGNDRSAEEFISLDKPLMVWSVQDAVKFNKEIMAQKGLYIHSVNKDFGQIILHKIPFDSSLKDTPLFGFDLSGFLTMADTAIRKVQPKSKKINREEGVEVASNIMYQLMDNGLIKMQDITNIPKVKKALDIYLDPKNNYVTNAGKINKYQPLAQGIEIPTSEKSFIESGILKKGESLRVIALSDPPRFAEAGEQSGLDGVLRIRQDVFDTMIKEMGMEGFMRFIKPVVFATAKQNKGIVKLKVGGFRAGEASNKLMIDNDIHMMVYDSGLKEGGRVKLNTLDYNKDTDLYSLKNKLDIMEVKPSEFHINVDVKEKYNVRNLKSYKQVWDKNNALELDSKGEVIFNAEYFNAVDSLREKSARGITEHNDIFQAALLDQKTFNQTINSVKPTSDKGFKLDFDLIDTNLIINEIDTNLHNPSGRWVAEQLLERSLDADFAKKETYTKEDQAVLEATNAYALGAARSNYAISYLLKQGNKQYLDSILGNYIAQREARINIEQGFDAVAFPFTEKLRAQGGIETDKFKRGDGAEKDPVFIDFEDVGEITLFKAWEKFKILNKNTPEYEAYKMALTFLNVRAPSSSNGSVRVQLFDGFVKDGGSIGYYSNEYNDMMQGGMDKDGDKIQGYQNLPSVIKKAFGRDSIQRELEKEDGSLMRVKDEDGAEGIRDRYFQSKDHEASPDKAFSTEERIIIGKDAVQGKESMGQFINGGVNIQLLMDIASKSNGKVDLGDGAYLKLINKDYKQLKKIVVVGNNLHADASTQKGLLTPRESLTKIFNDYFEYYYPKDKSLFKRKNGSMKLGEDITFTPLNEEPVTFDLSYFTIFNPISKHSAPALRRWKAFQEMLNDKAELSSMQEVSRKFLEYWDKDNEGTPVKNYYVQIARRIAANPRLQLTEEFSYTKYSNLPNLIEAIERTGKAIKGSKLLENLKQLDYYSVSLSQNERKLLQKNPELLEQRVNEIVGIGLMIKRGEVLLDVLSKVPGMNSRKAIQMLREITNRTFELKQMNRQTYLNLRKAGLDTKNNGEASNPINLFNFITRQKEGISSMIESFGLKNQKLTKEFKQQLEEFYDFSLLANSIPAVNRKSMTIGKTGKLVLGTFKDRKGKTQSKGTLDKNIARLEMVNEAINKSLKESGPSIEITRLYAKRAGILKDVTARAEIFFSNPAINRSSQIAFHAELDAFILKTKEIKADRVPAPDKKVPKLDKKVPEPDKKVPEPDKPEAKVDNEVTTKEKWWNSEKSAVEKVEEEIKAITEEGGSPTTNATIRHAKYSKIKNFNIEEVLLNKQQDPNLTERGQIALLDFHDLMTSRPGMKDYIPALFESWSKVSITGSIKAKPFEEIGVNDLIRFTDYLRNHTTPGWLKKFLYDPAVKRTPQWQDHILSQELTEGYLQGATEMEKDKTFSRVENIVEDKHGNITFKTGMVPTTTLAYGTEIQFAFHEMDNSFREWVKSELVGESIDFVTREDSNILGPNFDIFTKIVKYSREYYGKDGKPGQSPMYLRLPPKEKKNIKLKAEKYNQILKDMIANKERFFIKDSNKEGKSKEVDANEVVKLLDEAYTSMLTKVYNDIIVSKAPQIRAKLEAAGFKLDEYVIKAEDYIDKDTMENNVENIVKLENQANKLIFFDKNGIISDTNKIHHLYLNIKNKGTGNVQNILKHMMAESDARFIEHHLVVKDLLKEHFPEVDFNKELTKKQLNKVYETKSGKWTIKELHAKILKLYEVDMRVGLGRFVNLDTGEVDSYVEHTGAYNFKSLRDANEVALKEMVDSKVSQLQNKNGDLIPKNFSSDIWFEYKNGGIGKELALTLQKQNIREQFDKENASGVDMELAMGEQSSLRLLSTRTEFDVDNSNRNITKSRSENQLPEWDTSFDATQRYLSASYSNWLRHAQNIKLKLVADEFVAKNPFGIKPEEKELAKNWQAYILDVFSNNNGFPTLRNFSNHGIKAKEAKILRTYLDVNFDRKELEKILKRRLNNTEIRFFEKIESQYGLTKIQKSRVEREEPLKPEDNVNKNRDGSNLDIEIIKSRRRDLVLKIRKENMEEILKPGNVNKIGRFGSVYGLYSDESVVSGLQRLDDFFGGNIIKNAPKSGTAREYYLVRKAKAWSELEGKFEMVSLLSHPKSAITNFYGGFSNTIVDEGWSSFRRANSESWLLNNIFVKGSFYETVNSKGEIVKNEFKSYNDIVNYIFKEGILENGLITEGYMSQKKGAIDRKRIGDIMVTDILNFRNKKGQNYLEMPKKEADALHSRTRLEAMKELGIVDGITDAGSYFMKQSEMRLRVTTAIASIINTRNILGSKVTKDLAFNDPVVMNLARKSVQASQFIYHATKRPNFSNTNLGRIMTRFQPYAWNSIGRRLKIYKGAKQEQWAGGLNTKRAQNQFTADVFALAMANIFAASIFEYALSPPMSWMQDTAELIFGDEQMRDRAFFSQYPHPALAPLSIATPPVSRFVLAPLTAMINGNYDRLWNYQFATYFPFGRLGKDMLRSIKSPAMAPDFLTGLPLHKFHNYTRDYFESQSMDDILTELREKNAAAELDTE